jgi:hypothetical protein
MTTVINKGRMAMAYGGNSRKNVAAPGQPKNIVASVLPRLVLKPGPNEVPASTLDKLGDDVALKRHVKAGHVVIVADPAPVAKPTPAPLPDDDTAFLAAWDAMSDADKATMEPTLTDHEKELLAARGAQ